jgi:hypothetical protein
MLRKARLRASWLRGWLEMGRRGEVSAAELAVEVERLLDDLAEWGFGIGVGSSR